ncbi:MAG: hypothetical protein FWF76_03685 [Oscillospiraceae bacterium]|nr:hypothetical protein [Oscillospiraceae bacterium]
MKNTNTKRFKKTFIVISSITLLAIVLWLCYDFVMNRPLFMLDNPPVGIKFLNVSNSETFLDFTISNDTGISFEHVESELFRRTLRGWRLVYPERRRSGILVGSLIFTQSEGSYGIRHEDGGLRRGRYMLWVELRYPYETDFSNDLPSMGSAIKDMPPFVLTYEFTVS